MAGGERPPVDAAAIDALLAHVDEALLGIDADGTITFASPATRRVLGHDPRSIVGQSVLSLLHPDDVADARNSIGRWASRSGAPRGESHQIVTADGRWIEVSYDASTGPEVAPFGSFVLTVRRPSDADDHNRELRARDLSDARLVRLASMLLSRPQEEFDLALEEAMVELSSLEWVTRLSLWRVDGKHMERRVTWEAPVQAPVRSYRGRVRIEASHVLRRVTALEEVHVRSVAHLPEEWAEERRLLVEAGVRSMLAVPLADAGWCTGMIMAEITIGDVAFSATHLSTLRSAAGILGAAFARHDAHSEMDRRELTDPLTGIPNRVAFEAAQQRALDGLRLGRSSGVAVAMVDLDRFKLVNDALGHEAGDRLLIEVSARLAAVVPSELLVARLGGDEFLVLVEAVGSDVEARAAVSELLERLEHPFEMDGRPFLLTASAGVAFTDEVRVGAVELLRRADVAMYQAKSDGGDRVVGQGQGLRADLAARLHRESELRQAVADDGIEVWFQGEWDLLDGVLVGAEALARWRHPTEGVITAADFLPLAEESGQVLDLGAQVLRKSLEALGGWLNRGLVSDFVLRVNLSARQLRQPGLVRSVADSLADVGVPASMLCLELTESTLLADPDQAVAVLQELRELGVGLAVDDFGTGYSSMLYLKRLPITSLKIDRAFVSGLPADTGDAAIVRATVQLAEALGLDITAEGVENTEQCDALRSIGCRRAQGFHLAMPEPPATFTERLDSAGLLRTTPLDTARPSLL